MKISNANPCIRCGTPRIVVRTWKEKIYGSTIINTQTACPDKACQKTVDGENKKVHDKNVALKKRSEQRMIEKREAYQAQKAAAADAKPSL